MHARRVNLLIAKEIALVVLDKVNNSRKQGPRDIILVKRSFNTKGVVRADFSRYLIIY